ncbi:MAG: hypothetical protein ACFCAD_24860 [Pleurocapsa sp.]
MDADGRRWTQMDADGLFGFTSIALIFDFILIATFGYSSATY